MGLVGHLRKDCLGHITVKSCLPESKPNWLGINLLAADLCVRRPRGCAIIPGSSCRAICVRGCTWMWGQVCKVA